MWLVHMCVPTTPPLLSRFTTAHKNQTREVYTRCQKNSDEFQGKHKPGGSNQAGWLEIFREITKTPSLEQNRPSLSLCKKGHQGWPQAQAGRPHLSAILWPPSHTHSLPLLLPIPSWFCSISFKILLTKIK